MHRRNVSDIINAEVNQTSRSTQRIEGECTGEETDYLYSAVGHAAARRPAGGLWRTAGEPAPKTAENPFRDVAETAYYYQAVLWAAEAGITKGVDETRFDPEATVTRAQAATLLCRAFGGEAEDASLLEGGAEQSEAEGVTPFVDVPADTYFADAVLWAAESGMTNGVDKTHFSPDAPCLRCQIVTFLYRAVQNR